MKSKISILEKKLTEAQTTINNLNKDLEKEKSKQMKLKASLAATSVDSKNSLKKNSGSFEKARCSRNLCSLKSANSLSQISSSAQDRSKSIEAQYIHEFRQLKSTYEEDLEFQKEELAAHYEAKIDEILYKKACAKP
ncbi:MAG: hypothetical protein R6V38_02520 [Roseovarius gahaiensis]